MSRQGKRRKLKKIWTGSGVLAITTKTTHVRSAALGHSRTARRPRGEMRFYADDQLDTTGELLKVFQESENQGEYHIWSMSSIKRAASGDQFVFMVFWERLGEAESIWEPVSRVFHDAPAVLRKELKALRLKAEQKALVQRYELRFLSIFCDLGGESRF